MSLIHELVCSDFHTHSPHVQHASESHSDTCTCAYGHRQEHLLMWPPTPQHLTPSIQHLVTSTPPAHCLPTAAPDTRSWGTSALPRDDQISETKLGAPGSAPTPWARPVLSLLHQEATLPGALKPQLGFGAGCVGARHTPMCMPGHWKAQTYHTVPAFSQEDGEQEMRATHLPEVSCVQAVEATGKMGGHQVEPVLCLTLLAAGDTVALCKSVC